MSREMLKFNMFQGKIWPGNKQKWKVHKISNILVPKKWAKQGGGQQTP